MKKLRTGHYTVRIDNAIMTLMYFTDYTSVLLIDEIIETEKGAEIKSTRIDMPPRVNVKEAEMVAQHQKNIESIR